MIYKILLPILVIALLVVVWLGYGRSPVEKKAEITIPTSSPTVVFTIAPTITKSDIPEGWQTYTNTKYGFTIYHPSNYKVLTAKEDLYGWDKAVVLFYGGGQSYDVAVELWNTESEYKEKYVDVDLAVFDVNGKFITLYDETKKPENKTLIASFKIK